MKKFLAAAVAVSMIVISASAVFAWGAEGVIPGTDIEYSGLSVAKNGVSVKLTNTSDYDVKASLKLTFFDKEGNSLGYSVIGLREIPAGKSTEISGNYLNGKWKACRDTARLDFSKMTYEPIYE